MNKIIFWRPIPPDVNLGAFLEFAKLWRGKIEIYYFHSLPIERKKCGWESKLEQDVVLKYIDSNNNESIRNIIEKNVQSIHVFSGIRGENEKILKYLLKCNSQAKITVISERPAMYYRGIFGIIERLGRFFVYRRLSYKYNNKINAFFILGENAIRQYKLYGFDGKNIFQYMYCPDIQSTCSTKSHKNNGVKFLYIGRFDDRIKGIKTLMSAINQVNDKNWSLDLVGGYGDYKDEVIKWCRRKKNVNFIGTWDYNQVCENMKNYDVCIVPSRFDGWNLTPNQAIHAGIATLISDQSGSEELIKYSERGLIFKANNTTDLSNKISYIIGNFNQVKTWKDNAQSYKKYITKEVVGQYFYDCILYTFFEKNEKPHCPWVKVKEKN